MFPYGWINIGHMPRINKDPCSTEGRIEEGKKRNIDKRFEDRSLRSH